MYNRFIPQPDGTYQKKRMQDRCPPTPPPTQKHNNIPATEYPPPPPPPPGPEHNASQPHPIYNHQKSHKNDSVSGFLRQLLPKDIDTADLLIIILLLLMAGDCEENKNNTLLTLALYFLL